MAKRAGNVNSEQKNILIEFVKDNPKVVEGKFCKNFTYKDSQKKWEEISSILNTVPNGGSKNWKQWRKVWQDLKTKTKNKKAMLNKNRAQTGGGPPSKDNIDDIENSILTIVSDTSVQGIANIKETIVPLFVPPLELEQNANADRLRSISFVEPTVEFVNVDSIFEGENNVNELPIENEIRIQSKPRIKNKSSKTLRLNRTLNATETMANMCGKKLELKENYYKQKLALMEDDIKSKKAWREEDLRTKKDIAQNLKMLTDLLSKNYP